MFERWKQRQGASGTSSLGYSRRRVDSFLAQIGAQHAHGIEAEILTAAIRDVRFPLAPLGYNPATIDRHLSELHDVLSGNVLSGNAVSATSAA